MRHHEKSKILAQAVVADESNVGVAVVATMVAVVAGYSDPGSASLRLSFLLIGCGLNFIFSRLFLLQSAAGSSQFPVWMFEDFHVIFKLLKSLVGVTIYLFFFCQSPYRILCICLPVVRKSCADLSLRRPHAHLSLLQTTAASAHVICCRRLCLVADAVCFSCR